MQIEAINYSVTVLGEGTMRKGIAQIAANAWHPVMLYDVSQQQFETALENIVKRLERSVKKEKSLPKKRANSGEFNSTKNSRRSFTSETSDWGYHRGSGY